MPIVTGIIAGILAGILMGTVSHIGYLIGIFRSNLILTDGTFILKTLKGRMGEEGRYTSGIITHLFTSASFGGMYIFLGDFLKLEATSIPVISLYVFFLWLSMLFIALPVAGQGFLGRKIGSLTWLEQFVLHIFFGLGLWGSLRILLS